MTANRDFPLPPIIALSGHDGVGKTTLARELHALLPGSVLLSLAGPLKLDAATHLGITVDEVFAKPTPPHLRMYLRAYGMAMRQVRGEDYWVVRFLAACGAFALVGGVTAVICDDMRHVNEFEAFDRQGAFLVALARDGIEPAPEDRDLPIVREVDLIRERVMFSHNPRHVYLRLEEDYVPRLFQTIAGDLAARATA